MANNLNKNRIFRNITKNLDSLMIMKYESEDSHANNILDPIIARTLIQLYVDGGESFSYIIGRNSNIERTLFCLNRLHMIHIYNEHALLHRQHISCSLTNMGSAYTRFVISGLSSHHIRYILNMYGSRWVFYRLLFNACLDLIPPSLTLFYMLWCGMQSDALILLCMAWCWLCLCTLPENLHLDIPSITEKYRLRHWGFNDSKTQFLSFCDQYDIWHYMDPHDLIIMIDRYMFNDHTYHERSFIARHDVPWNRHYHS